MICEYLLLLDSAKAHIFISPHPGVAESGTEWDGERQEAQRECPNPKCSLSILCLLSDLASWKEQANIPSWRHPNILPLSRDTPPQSFTRRFRFVLWCHDVLFCVMMPWTIAQGACLPPSVHHHCHVLLTTHNSFVYTARRLSDFDVLHSRWTHCSHDWHYCL